MNNEEITERIVENHIAIYYSKKDKPMLGAAEGEIKAALDAKDNQWISVESLDKETFDGTSEALAWNGDYYLLGYVYYDSHDNMFGCENENGFLFDVTHFYEPKPPTNKQ